jgi:ribonuclease HI
VRYVPDVLNEDALTIYVDGSQRGKPRRGGIGIHFVWVNKAGDEECHDEPFPSTKNANNQQMELEAPSAALEIVHRGRLPVEIARFEKIVIRSDSKYVCENVNNAKFVWPKNKWRTQAGAAVQNVADWETLLKWLHRFYREHRIRVEFEWVPGKKGRHAAIVDKLAKKSSDRAAFGRARPALVRRKKTTAEVASGSVRVTGQVMVVHVIEVRYVPKRRTDSRCKYEVISDNSHHQGAVDWAETDQPVDAGHTYQVRMNDDQANPRIVKVLEEVTEDLGQYVDALKAFGRPATIKEIRAKLPAAPKPMSRGAVQLRLDRLVDEGQAQRERSPEGRRPYVYEIEPEAVAALEPPLPGTPAERSPSEVIGKSSSTA